jgi:RHS repeat-associated protein
LDIAQVDIQVDESTTTMGFFDRYRGFQPGTRVYVTLPDGTTEGFTFQVVAGTSFMGLVFDYHGYFVPDPGNTVSLSVPDVVMQNPFGTGEYLAVLSDGYMEYNPANPIFGASYTITTSGRYDYEIDPRTSETRKISDVNANYLTFTENKIEANTGERVTFERDYAGRITGLIDPLGNKIRYEYGAAGDLVSVIEPVSADVEYTTQFQYHPERAHYLNAIIDPDGNSTARTEFDADGRVAKLINSNGDTIDCSYDIGGHIQRTTDAYGNVSTSQYDAPGNLVRLEDPLGAVTTWAYDARGNLLAETDPVGRVTAYTYSEDGLPLSVVSPHPDGADAALYTMHYEYDANGKMTSAVYPNGDRYTWKYDARGNLLEERDADGTLIVAYTYDQNARPLSETRFWGTLYYAYDMANRRFTLTNTDGTTLQSTFDALGNILTLTDSDGTSTYQYDQRNRMTRIDFPDGEYIDYGYGSTDEWTSITFSGSDTIARSIDANGHLTSWTTPEGENQFAYDSAGRVSEISDVSGTITRYEYDAAGHITRAVDALTGATIEREYDLAGRVTAVTDVMGNTTRTSYNEDGSVTVTDARGNSWTTASSFYVTTVEDPLGRETTSTIQEGDEWTLTVRNPDGSFHRQTYQESRDVEEPQPLITSFTDESGRVRGYAYDTEDRLVTATDLAGNVYQYERDADGRVTTTQGPTLEHTDYAYTDGNLTQITFANGRTQANTYNADGRIEMIERPSGTTLDYTYNTDGYVEDVLTSAGEHTTFAYASSDGQLARSQNEAGAVEYGYDQVGRLERLDFPDTGGSVQYGRDALGRITSVVVQASAASTAYATTYAYDAVGNLVTVVDPYGETTFEYDAANRLVTRTLPNGIVTTYSYDDRDNLVSIQHVKDGAVLSSVTYVRQGIGEPTKIIREDGTYVEIEYDDALRISRETYYDAVDAVIEELAYEYDAAGNRIALLRDGAASSWDYDLGHELSHIGLADGSDEWYTHDDDGRLTVADRYDGIADEFAEYLYDSFDNLTAVKDRDGSERASYEYDSRGNRVVANGDAGEQHFLVAPSPSGLLDLPWLVTDSAGNLLSGYVYVGRMPLMRFDQNGQPVYYLEDASGSVIGLADAQGNSAGRAFYDSFGNVRSSTLWLPAGVGGDFRFQGAWLDESTGLYHMGAREYAPHIGQFLAMDPATPNLFVPETTHPYTFAFGNPHVYTDPTGKFTIMSISVSMDINTQWDAFKSGVVQKIRNDAKDKVLEFTQQALWDTFLRMLPIDVTAILAGLKGMSGPYWQMGLEVGYVFEQLANTYIKPFLPPDMNVYFEPSVADTPVQWTGIPEKGTFIAQPGDAVHNGFPIGDARAGVPRPISIFQTLNLFRSELSRPDFILSTLPPTKTYGTFRGALVGDVKLARSTIYHAYKKGGSKLDQFEAMNKYASEHAWHVVVLVALAGNAGMNEIPERTVTEAMLKQMKKYENVIVIATIFEELQLRFPGLE